MEKLEQLKNLVNIKSFSLTENKEIIAYLETEFGKVATEIIKLKNVGSNRENLLIGLNCKLSNIDNALVLSGHIDTVTANEKEYNTNPYEATIIDNKLYGLGSIDMKSYFAVILNNINELKQLNIPVVIAITGDEETDFEGVNLITEKMKELNIIPKLSIIGEPTSSDICDKSKGCFEYKIEVFGKSCHSSNPSNGVNANYILAKLILKIEELSTKFDETTMSCNVISGGSKVNIISDYATLKFDLRTYNTKIPEMVEEIMLSYCKELENEYAGSKITLINEFKICPLQNNNPKLITKISEKFNKQVKSFIGGCEAGYYAKVGGSGFVYGVGDLALAHKPNEYADITEFIVYSDGFINFITMAYNWA